MRLVGFSTGAIAKGEVVRALEVLQPFQLPAVELSALRLAELPRLVDLAGSLKLDSYQYVSVHAPSRFSPLDEPEVVALLRPLVARGWPVIVHPDVLYDDQRWLPFGSDLVIENNDRRKVVGRTASDLDGLFRRFPEAGFCLDVGHVRQVDPTMHEASAILRANWRRLRQIHISDVNYFSRHDPLSSAAIEATRRIAHWIPRKIPIIIESVIDNRHNTIKIEVERTLQALPSPVHAGVGQVTPSEAPHPSI